MTASLSDTIPEKEFFTAITETDGKKAVGIYKILLDHYPGQSWAPYALERIIAYDIITELPAEAKYYLKQLRRDYPDFRSSIDLEELFATVESFDGEADKIALTSDAKRKIWSVQVGVFRNKKGALEVGKTISSLGKVIYKEKHGSKGTLTIVRIGSFAYKEEAESLAERVRKKSGLNPVVVLSGEEE